jgi:hypothetical protein
MSDKNTTEKTTEDRIESITKDLVELGTVWAKYGLSIGRQALETSAKSLSKTADMLGQIADAVDAKKQPEGGAKGVALRLLGARRSSVGSRGDLRVARAARGERRFEERPRSFDSHAGGSHDRYISA